MRKRTTIWLDQEDTEALEKISRQSLGKPPIAGLIREAIKQFIQNHTASKKK